MLVRRQERRAQNRVVPVENNASLRSLRLVLRPQPNFVVSETRKKLIADLLVRARVRTQVRFVVSHEIRGACALLIKPGADL